MASFIFRRRFWLLLILVFALYSTSHIQGAGLAAYHRLLKDKMTDYETQVRPVQDDAESLEVYMELELLSIVDVNEEDQTLVTSARLRLSWEDDFLTWNTSDYDGIDEILLKQKKVWLPDIVLGNGVSASTELGYKNLQLRVLHDGLVTWDPTALLKTSCSIDITYYPMDTQVCNIQFMTAVSRQSEIHIFINKKDPIDASHYSENGLWDLLNYTAQNLGEEHYEDQRAKIEFRLQLQRRREFYLLNIVLPILFLSLTSSLTFALPADAGEKMGLSITILLAYAVYLTLVTDSMPSTSLQVSYLAVYLIILLGVTALSVVLSVWILSYHHRNEKRPVKGWLAKVTVTLGKVLRMPLEEGEKFEEVDQQDLEPMTKKNAIAPYLVHDDAASELPEPAEKTSEGRSHGNRKRAGSTFNRKVVAVSGRQVAETFDRLIFIVFFLISIISTVIIMLILVFGSIRQEEETRL